MTKLLLPSLLAACGLACTLVAQETKPAVPPARGVAEKASAKPEPPIPGLAPVPAADDPFVKGGAKAKPPAPKSAALRDREALEKILGIDGLAPAAPPVPGVDDPSGKGGAADDPFSPSVPGAEAPPVIHQALLETYDLPREDFLTLLDGPGDDEARYRRIVEWTAAGRAKLVTFTALSSRSGQKTVAESIDEVRYATDFYPPAAEEDAAYPTVFATRNTGETLELEMTVGEDGQTAEINLVPQSVRLVKFIEELASPGRPTSAFAQPRFATRKLTTSVTLAMNHPRLLGTLSGADDDGASAAQVRLAFLTVRPSVLPAAKPEALVPDAGLLRLEYTFFSLDRAAARELWLGKPDPQMGYDALRALVAKKEARLEHVSISVIKSGQRTITEEIEETRFATEFQPPAVPGENGGIGDTSSAPSDEDKDEKGKKDVRSKAFSTASALVQFPRGAWPKKAAIPATPGSFETRNTGFTAEVEPTLGPDGATVDLRIVLEFVRNRGPLEVTGIGKTYPPQPLFETRKFTGSCSATVGQQQFLSTFNMPVESGANGRKDDGRVWLGFVRVVAVK